MSISKRNFEAIALAFQRVRAEDWTEADTALDRVAEEMAITFAGENEYFDRERFLARCGNTDLCVACKTFHYANTECPSEALDKEYLKPLTMADPEHPLYGQRLDEIDTNRRTTGR